MSAGGQPGAAAVARKAVGQVTSGLLLGIMLARSASSFTAAVWGWRSIYAVSAVVMLLTSLALYRMLPVRQPSHSAGYRALLGSVLRLARTERLLRQRALAQACMFGAFTAFWTAISYELTGRHHLSQTSVAVFALVGPPEQRPPGRRTARGRRSRRGGTAGAAVLGLLSMVLAGLAAANLYALALAAVLMDFAVQSNGVLSQRDIYALHPDARARLNSVYMTSVFLGARRRRPPARCSPPGAGAGSP
ncbi:MFS transporter [Streptacidiphilus sp. 4-A2]|nr:MFS transporter [Streptacidiphilus sp. 4-A2]